MKTVMIGWLLLATLWAPAQAAERANGNRFIERSFQSIENKAEQSIYLVRVKEAAVWTSFLLQGLKQAAL